MLMREDKSTFGTTTAHLNIAVDISIWLVEDNQHFRQTMQNMINQSQGMECNYAFDSCEAAIEELRTGEPPEVILLDIGLKGMNGVEGVKRFREISPATRVIMLTIHEDSNLVFDALCSGASGYLLKDSSPERVIDAVKEVVSGGAPINPQIARKVVEMFKQFNAPHADKYGLTEREKQVLGHLVNGLSKKQIAERLFISFHTVNTHIKNIYEKLQVNTQGSAISKAYKERLV